MADCYLCGLSVVTTNFVKVPSDALAWEETGRWMGLCDGCLRACGRADDSARSARKGHCAICRVRDVPLYRVSYAGPSLGRPKKDEAWVCRECLKACRYTATRPYDAKEAKGTKTHGH